MMFASLLSAALLLSTLTLGVDGHLAPQGRRQLKQKDVLELYKNVYQDPATELRSAIVTGDLNLTISLLTAVSDPKVLGAGLRYPSGEADVYDVVTVERVSDPDVTTIKAIAGASLRLASCSWKSAVALNSAPGDASEGNQQINGLLKLAEAVMIAITPESGVFPPDVNQFMLHVNLIQLLADHSLMQEVVEDDVKASQLNRRLLIRSGSPVNTWFCAHCYPGKLCRNTCWWC